MYTAENSELTHIYMLIILMILRVLLLDYYDTSITLEKFQQDFGAVVYLSYHDILLLKRLTIKE